MAAVTAVVVAAAATLVVIAEPSAEPASAAPSCDTAAASEAEALTAAASCNRPVVVGPSRSEYVQTVAQPDGSLSLESAVLPQRTRGMDGTWDTVDLALRAGGDGLLRPVASVADVAFSGGGSTPLVTLRRSGKSMSLSWHGTLPTPTVSGDSATYAEVLPDVDLVVRATRTGFAHLLVAKTAQAAANPAVRTISFDVSGDATLVRGAGGALRAVAGRTVLADADRAVMWDSTTSAQPASTSSADESTAAEAGDAAQTAAVETRVTAEGDLELVPDASLLTSPATTYPVYIDPDWSVARSKWAYATSNGCTNTDYSRARGGLSPEGPCVGAKFRSYFEFPTTNGTVSLKGKYIKSAYVRMTAKHSWSCTDTWAHMFLTPAINATMKASWSSMALKTWLAAAEGHANKDSGCSDSPQADMTMNFTGWPVTSQVQAAATGSWNTVTVGFCACNDSGQYESEQDRWKKFDPAAAALVVDYDSNPTPPNGLMVGGVACPSGGVAIGTLAPAFSAIYPDKDSGQTLTGTYEWVEVPPNYDLKNATDTYPLRLAAPPTAAAPANGRALSVRVSWGQRFIASAPDRASSGSRSVEYCC